MTRQQKQAYWFDHLRAWRDSGLSQPDYCQRHGLALGNFGYWRQRERQAKAQAVPALHLLPVRIAPATLDQPLRLRGPGAWALELPAGTSSAWLADVLRALA